MNSITISEIKRGGMDALDLALNRGATVIMKRNRAAAVVLTPESYAALIAKSSQNGAQSSALDWLLNLANTYTYTSNLSSAATEGEALAGEAMEQRLGELKIGWAE